MQSAGGRPFSTLFFFSEDNGGSPMEYVLAASILVALGGLMLMAVARAW